MPCETMTSVKLEILQMDIQQNSHNLVLFGEFEFDSHKYTLINDLGQDINTQETNHR